VVTSVAVTALLAGSAAIAGTMRHTGGTTAAPPKPSATAPATSHTTPAPSSSAPPSSAPSRSPSAAPSTPPGLVPGSPPSAAQQPGSLTPQQSAAAATVSKGLVDINTTVGYDGSKGAGTGIVLSADGLVLTNHHVVAGATSVRVTDVGNARTYDATVLGYDSTHDLAVLRLKNASGLTVAPLGSSASVRVGDAVVAVGNAGGAGGTPSAVGGSVQALDQQITVQDDSDGSARRLTGLIEFDAGIQPGDSGGALVDAGAKVVGVVTAGSFGTASSDTGSATDGYAVPIDQARSIAQQIIDGRSSSTVHIGATGFLGVQVVPAGRLGASTGGVEVGGVIPGSPAEQAGIQAGDVLTAVDGHAVSSTAELHTRLAQHRPGDTVTVAWTDSAGQPHSAHVRLTSGPVG
jgi:S1-C subfamily serine protease